MAFKGNPFRRKRSNQTSNVWQVGGLRINRALRIPIIIFGIIFVYSIAGFAISHYNPVKTTPAQQVSLDDSFSASGYFIRQEQTVDIAEGNTVEYNYSDGDKVSKGAALVTEYSNQDALTVSRELKSINDNIEQLETFSSTSSTTTNSSRLNQKIIDQMNLLSEQVDNGSLGQVASIASELRQLVLKSGSVSDNSKDIKKELANLKQQAASLESRLDGKTTNIYSPCAGYFCESADGYESIFTPDVVDELTLSSLEKLSKKNPASTSGKGKVVSGYVWYYAAKVSDADAKNLKQGNSVKLRFSQISQDVSATIQAVRDDESNDSTLVIFQSEDMDAELVSMREQVATVVVDSYAGPKVPKSAVRMENDEMGVYVLSNSVASYKKIDPLYEGSDFYIVKQNVTGNDSLVVNDDIIVEAKDVNDKKVMK